MKNSPWIVPIGIRWGESSEGAIRAVFGHKESWLVKVTNVVGKGFKISSNIGADGGFLRRTQAMWVNLPNLAIRFLFAGYPCVPIGQEGGKQYEIGMNRKKRQSLSTPKSGTYHGVLPPEQLYEVPV